MEFSAKTLPLIGQFFFDLTEMVLIRRGVLLSCRLMNSSTFVLDPCLSTLSLSPSSLEVVKYENESYFVFCQTDDKIQIPKIYWTKGKSQQIDNKGLTYVAPYGNGTALFFGRITSKDSGEYACHARDEVVAFKLIVTCKLFGKN